MRRPKKDPPTGVQVAITPMLDMTFQLLFFFLLNYHPSMLEGQMSMALPPDKSEAKAEKPQDVSTANDAETDTLPADLTVVIKTQNDGFNNGTITQLQLVGREGPQDVKNLDDLLAKLKEAKANGGLQNANDIKLQPDSKLSWASVLKVMDVCAKADFHVGFGAPPDRGVGQQ
jgi:biopolymer transport protein ExbD